MINVFKFIFDLLQATELNKQIILFCENENQFKKIFQKKLNFLSLVSSKTIFVIIYKNNLKFRSKNIKVISINSEFSLRLLFSLINNCIVVTTTPTINKELLFILVYFPPFSVPRLTFEYSLNVLFSPISKNVFSPLNLRSWGIVPILQYG